MGIPADIDDLVNGRAIGSTRIGLKAVLPHHAKQAALANL
jgi:hypothetical protein